MQHSDYVAGYMQLGEVLKTLTIHAGSFSISKQQFIDQPVTELTSSGVKYTRAPLGARVLGTSIQLNETNIEDGQFNRRINFNGQDDSQDAVAKGMTQAEQKYYGKTAEGEEKSEQLRFLAWILNCIGLESNGAMQSIMSFSDIKSLFMTFAMPQYPIWFYPILLNDFDLVIDQRYVIAVPYEALTQTVNGLMFDCFVDQDVVSAPSDLYHSLTFENFNCTDRTGGFYGKGNVNIIHTSTLFEGTKESKTLYPNQFMLA
ncbi:MAG: hypothetical protein EZS28_008165 [Streblomastix strix]|uniref:Uncharacterized protein n=1 Tax=Streblomastix strix TaxID=222440 RepID=A0A5J4WQ83_9EUKA|nr:MAG: hypothetical protein EZS28_008165 [Streblomastix strix]